MVIGIIGENCSGKSTLAAAIQNEIGGELITGKDYLRLAKSEGVAAALFRKKLAGAMETGHLIYVISDRELLDFLPEGALRILVRAELETIKERFRRRLHGQLPPPVEQMLERKHGCFDEGRYDFVFDSSSDDTAALCAAVKARLG